MSKDFKLKTINPATCKNIKHYDPMSDSEMNKAVDACHKAFSDWKLMPTLDRAKIIKNIGKKLAEHKDELAKLMTQEMGKLEKEAKPEVDLCSAICDYTAETGPEALKDEERVLP